MKQHRVTVDSDTYSEGESDAAWVFRHPRHPSSGRFRSSSTAKDSLISPGGRLRKSRPRFHDSTIPRFNDSTIPRFHDSAWMRCLLQANNGSDQRFRGCGGDRAVRTDSGCPFRLCIGPSRWMSCRLSLICLTASLANTTLLSQLVDISNHVIPLKKK
jgi:hypothetical protein